MFDNYFGGITSLINVVNVDSSDPNVRLQCVEPTRDGEYITIRKGKKTIKDIEMKSITSSILCKTRSQFNNCLGDVKQYMKEELENVILKHIYFFGKSNNITGMICTWFETFIAGFHDEPYCVKVRNEARAQKLINKIVHTHSNMDKGLQRFILCGEHQKAMFNVIPAFNFTGITLRNPNGVYHLGDVYNTEVFVDPNYIGDYLIIGDVTDETGVVYTGVSVRRGTNGLTEAKTMLGFFTTREKPTYYAVKIDVKLPTVQILNS